MRRRKTTVIIVMCVAMLFMAVGYALLSTKLNINGSTVVTSSWRVEFTAIRTTNITGGAFNNHNPTLSSNTVTFKVNLVQPGDQITYEIDITNFGDIIAEVKGATYSIDGSEAIYVDIDGVRKGTQIGSCEGLSTCPKATMTIKVGYDPAVEKDPTTKTKTIDITLDIGQYVSSNPTADAELIPELVEQNDTLVQQILRNNAAQNDRVIDFSKANYYISSWYPNYLTATGTQSGLSSTASYCFGTGRSLNSTTGMYTLTGASCGTLSAVKNAVLYGTNPWTCLSTSTTGTCDTVFYVSGIPSTTSISFSAVEEAYPNYTTNGEGLFYTSSKTEGDQLTYYFRGRVTNNYVKFGSPARLWRIVRINEDGSVRIITNDIINTSLYNSSAGSNAYVGFEYGATTGTTYALTHANTTNSTIRTALNTFWNSELAGYNAGLSGKLFVDGTGFCNDRSLSFGTGAGTTTTTYAFSNRYSLKQPQFKCPQINDLFTTSLSSRGNHELSSPIGLITGDELLYLGAVGSNKNHYLYNGSSYWTMTPHGYNLTNPSVASVYIEYASPGGIYYAPVNSSTYAGLRPVVNLSPKAKVTGGTGTSTDPYIINVAPSSYS